MTSPGGNLNKQSLFETAAKHLLTQGVKSINGNRCLYRGPKGLKCAIGALIPDEAYKPRLEGHPAYNQSVIEALGLKAITSEDETFLSYLQTVHDRAKEVDGKCDFMSGLITFAERFKLDPSCLNIYP